MTDYATPEEIRAIVLWFAERSDRDYPLSELMERIGQRLGKTVTRVDLEQTIRGLVFERKIAMAPPAIRELRALDDATEITRPRHLRGCVRCGNTYGSPATYRFIKPQPFNVTDYNLLEPPKFQEVEVVDFGPLCVHCYAILRGY